jgi:acetyl-CoA synthetase
VGTAADVIDAEARPLRGQVGELAIRQPLPGMTRGFWNDPQRYLETYWSRFPGIWVHGDWALIDEDGYWFIQGRSDDTLKVAGKRVGPAEVESAAVAHAAVQEAAAIGVPHPKWLERPLLVVVKAPGKEVQADELKKFLETKLVKWWLPDAIEFVDELAHTATGKLSKLQLRERFKDYRFANAEEMIGRD